MLLWRRGSGGNLCPTTPHLVVLHLLYTQEGGGEHRTLHSGLYKSIAKRECGHFPSAGELLSKALSGDPAPSE